MPLIRQYLVAGNNPDAPGNFIPWLIGRKEVYAYRFPGQRYDIGTLENYRQAVDRFRHGLVSSKQIETIGQADHLG